jgi:hypothetical protein
MTNTDRDLRELFARLKQEDRAQVPAFRVAPTVALPSAQRPLRALLVAAAVVVVVLSAEVGRRMWGRPAAPWAPGPRPSALSLGRSALNSSSPTDFLLNTPGSELLRTVPRFGVAPWIHQRNRS